MFIKRSVYRELLKEIESLEYQKQSLMISRNRYKKLFENEIKRKGRKNGKNIRNRRIS